jgi:hypothetical protein
MVGDIPAATGGNCPLAIVVANVKTGYAHHFTLRSASWIPLNRG